MSRLLIAAILLAACDPPSPLLRLRLDDGLCPSTDCAEVPMLCRTWISIRVVDPADPTAPYLSQCQEVPQDRKKDMCSVASIELDTKELPLRGLEVQVALFPESMIGTDPTTGDPICPADTQYDASSGFPVASAESPAVGGRTYYHPNDDKVVVNLGCVNLDAINAGCGGVGAISISAGVNDFDSGVTFTGQMTVSVGEPIIADPFYVLPPPQLHPLEPAPVQHWAGNVADPFKAFACLAVLDDAPQSTTSLVCRRAVEADLMLSWPTAAGSTEPDPTRRVGFGVRLSKAALDQMLSALALPAFPTHGLTIGIVLDENGDPVANQVVTPSAGTIQYFSADRSSVGGTKTTSSGVWASTDAQFGTGFSAFGGSPPTPITRIGGMIDGKVTIVVLQFGSGTGG